MLRLTEAEAKRLGINAPAPKPKRKRSRRETHGPWQQEGPGLRCQCRPGCMWLSFKRWPNWHLGYWCPDAEEERR